MALAPRSSYRLSAFYLSPGDRADVRDVPADARERLHDGNNHDHQEDQMNQRSDDRPEKYQNPADTRDCPKYRMNDCGHDVKEKPRATKNDRLHRVKTHKTIVLLENIKNDAADQRNAGDGCSNIGR